MAVTTNLALGVVIILVTASAAGSSPYGARTRCSNAWPGWRRPAPAISKKWQ